MLTVLKTILLVIGCLILLVLLVAGVTYIFYRLFPPGLYEEEQNDIEEERRRHIGHPWDEYRYFN